MANEKRLLIGVGSRNPVKVGAVEAVMQRVLAEKLLAGLEAYAIEGLEVPSGVSNQPMSEAETIQGALNRARKVLEARPQLEWGVGLEGGLMEVQDELFTCAWCAIVDRQGNSSLGGGLIMPLPTAIRQDIRAGIELGEATDRLFNTKNSKHAGGALGYLSKDLHSRQRAYEGIFTYALVKFLHPELYDLK